MVTALVDSTSFKKLQKTGKKVGVDVKQLDPANVDSSDSLYFVDYTHTYGVGLAKKVKTENPAAKIVMFYPSVRSYVRSEIGKMGFIPFESADFFSKIKDIMKGKI